MKLTKLKSNNKHWCVVEGNLYAVKKNGVLSAYTDHTMRVHLFDYEKYFSLTLITEEQASEVVEMYPIVKNNRKFFKNYQKQGYHEKPWVDTPLDSFSSLLQANEVWFENPFKKPCITQTKFSMFGSLYHTYVEDLKKYNEAQQKVWNKEQTYIFKLIQ